MQNPNILEMYESEDSTGSATRSLTRRGATSERNSTQERSSLHDRGIHILGIWNDPHALRCTPEAASQIAGGIVAETEKLGIRIRSARSADVDAEPSIVHEKPPDLSLQNLLLFTDAPSSAQSLFTNDTWESVQPPSYVDWAYRWSPWHGNSSQPVAGTSRAVSATPSISRLSNSGQPSQTLDAISEAPPCKSGRAVSATPTSIAGSTRVPSRATQASPEESAKPWTPVPPSRPPPHGRRAPRSHAAPSTYRGASPDAQSPDSGRTDAATPVGVMGGDMTRTSSPDTRGRATEPSGGAAALSLAEKLGIEADAAGERARGAVTMAIRAQAICRNAVNAASRRLLHLNGDRPGPPLPASEAQDGGNDARHAKEKVGPNFHQHFPSVPSVSTVNDAFACFASPNSDDARRRRVIKVPRNTPLGRMVLKDPKRATKYNLVAVPSWTHNKPWPPPPVKFAKNLSFKRKTEDVEEKSPEPTWRQQLQMSRSKKMKHDAVRKSKAEVRALTRFLSLPRPHSGDQGSPYSSGTEPALVNVRQISDGSLSDSRVATKVGITNENAGIISKSNLVDLDVSATLLDFTEKEQYKSIFRRYASDGVGALSRAGMVKALQAAGIRPTTSQEQQQFAAVQEQVVNHTRPVDSSPETNPVKSPTGVWHMREFILLVEALREIGARKRRQSNKERADEFNMSYEDVEEMRDVFKRFDSDNSGSINYSELKALLQAVEITMKDEELMALVQSVGIDATEQLDFPLFMRVAAQIDELAQPRSSRIIRRAESRSAGVEFREMTGMSSIAESIRSSNSQQTLTSRTPSKYFALQHSLLQKQTSTKEVHRQASGRTVGITGARSSRGADE